MYFYWTNTLPIVHKSVQIAKITILNLEGIIKKITYERRESRLWVSRRKEKSILNYVPESDE